MMRAWEVIRDEGCGAAFRAAARKVLRRLGLSGAEFTLQGALESFGLSSEPCRARLYLADAEVFRRFSSGANHPEDSGKTAKTASIILVTYNNLDYTRLCLAGIYRYSSIPGVELVIVDNASSDGTQEYLEGLAAQLSHIRLILNESNAGFAAANNQGILAAQNELLIFLNNDTIVTPGWLERFLDHLSDPKVGMVGPRTNYWGNESRIEVHYRSLEEMTLFADRLRQENLGRSFDINMLALFCTAMRREVVEEVGLLDERFGVGMFEDDDYSLRTKKLGYQVRCAEDVFVHHWGKASFSKLERERYNRLFDENRRKFEEKWGVTWEAPAIGNKN